MRRHTPSKQKSAKRFNQDSHTTKRANVITGPMRGGIRM